MSAQTWKCRCGVDVLFDTTHYCGGIAKTVTLDPMHRVRKLESENQRLREELDVLRETHDETQLARMQLQGERARLRAAIEKLRDNAGRYSPYVPSGWLARRLTELSVHGDET